MAFGMYTGFGLFSYLGSGTCVVMRRRDMSPDKHPFPPPPLQLLLHPPLPLLPFSCAASRLPLPSGCLCSNSITTAKYAAVVCNNSSHVVSDHDPAHQSAVTLHMTRTAPLRVFQALENGNEASSGLGPSYSELTGHLSEASTHFFQHWLRLVELEEAPLQGKRAEIWKMTGPNTTPLTFWLCTHAGTDSPDIE